MQHDDDDDFNDDIINLTILECKIYNHRLNF